LIFVTVGTQGPFDRLVQAMDRWAARTVRTDVVAQIGAGAWKPAQLAWREYLEPAAHREAFEEAEIVVAHAGIGTLVSALELGKTIVVMPRLARLGEHRNDHQLATARHFCSRHEVRVAQDEIELGAALDELLRQAAKELEPAPRRRLEPSPTLLESVRGFIETGR